MYSLSVDPITCSQTRWDYIVAKELLREILTFKVKS